MFWKRLWKPDSRLRKQLMKNIWTIGNPILFLSSASRCRPRMKLDAAGRRTNLIGPYTASSSQNAGGRRSGTPCPLQDSSHKSYRFQSYYLLNPRLYSLFPSRIDFEQLQKHGKGHYVLLIRTFCSNKKATARNTPHGPPKLYRGKTVFPKRLKMNFWIATTDSLWVKPHTQ